MSSRTLRFSFYTLLLPIMILVAAVSISMVANPTTAYAVDSGSAEMYRLYNPNSGEHFYTADPSERENLLNNGWHWEGAGWVAPSHSNAPVYRLYSGTDHHYTMDAGERDWLKSVGWKDEGIGWYSSETRRVPLYRQFNPFVQPRAWRNNAGSHNYTTSMAENDSLVRNGWKAEGIGWYAIQGGWSFETPVVRVPAASSGGNNSPSAGQVNTVYVTASGKSFHRSSCASTSGKWTRTLTRAQAISQGYAACKVCKP